MIKNKLHTLTEEQRDILKEMTMVLNHNWQANINRILRLGTYSNQDKRLILNPLREKYIEYLRKTKS